MKKRVTPLVFIFTAIITVVCQCQMTNNKITLNGHPCTFTGSYDTDNSQYDGTFTCKNPDNSNLTCPYTNQPVKNSQVFLRNQTAAMSDEQFWAYLGCVPASQASPTPRATITATPVPATATSTPAAAGSVQSLSAPLLTGDVTACSVDTGFINFKLVEGLPPLNGSDVTVVIGGTQVSCVVPSNNTSLLSCGLPAGVAFPAQVSVARGGGIANEFSYNGAACLYTEPSIDKPDNDPSATDVPPTNCPGDKCP